MAPAAARGRGVRFPIWSACRWLWWSSPPTSPNGRFVSWAAYSVWRWETWLKDRARAGNRGSVPPIGVHARGPGPGDTVSLPYFEVDDLADALRRVQALGGSVIHPGERWAVCKDSEGSPFGVAARPR